jgi:carboxylesterase type B
VLSVLFHRRRTATIHRAGISQLNWDIAKNGILYTPTVGGTVLPDQWIDLFRAGRFHHVPVMIGNTKEEARLLTSIHENNVGRKLTREDVRELANGSFSDQLDEVVRAALDRNA